MRKRIEGKLFGAEAPMQGLSGTNLYDCVFSGTEHALKDARDVSLENCRFTWSSPLWNVQNFKINDCRVEDDSLSALWNCENGKIQESDLKGDQALRACRDIVIRDCSIFSEAFGWNCDTVILEECNIHAGDVLRESRNIRLDNVEVRGDAALQNTDGIHIYNSFLHSSNALHNSRNVTIVDSVLKGDLLCWNCENITLIGCKIVGLQPMCHCRGLKLIDCSMEGSDLAFEYSEVKASIVGHLHSVKNPLAGQITADTIGQVIMDDEALESTAKITVRA